MYLSKQSTNALWDIVSALNKLDSEQAQIDFLEAHVEDPAQLLDALKRMNKKKLPKQSLHEPIQKNQTEVSVYEAAQLDAIFEQKNDETILQEYSLTELRNMYYSTYRQRAASKSKKESIVRALRRYYFSAKRGEAFAHLANQRK